MKFKFNDFIQDAIDKGGVEQDTKTWIKKTTKIVLTLALAGLLLGFSFKRTLFGTLIGGVIAGSVTFFFLIFSLTYKSYKRAKDIEDTLPDALELISSGIKAGLPVRNAFESITRPEFGVLSNEISRVFVEESTGIGFEEALLKSTKRISSALYEKSIGTLVKSIQTGVNIDKIAESLSKNINEIKNIRKDIKASTVTYTLFLAFAALFASPILFSLSSFLVTSNVLSGGDTAQDIGSSLPSSFASVAKSAAPPTQAIGNFFVVAIIIVSVSTSIAIGIVNKGSYKEGIKIAPFFVTFALVIFFVAKSIVTSYFGS